MSYTTLRCVAGTPKSSGPVAAGHLRVRVARCLVKLQAQHMASAPRRKNVWSLSLSHPFVQPRRSAFCRVYAQQGTEKLSPAEWDHVLVAIIDSNPTLSTASRSALATAAAFAARGKLTCLFLDDQGKEVDGSRIQLIQRQLEEKGFSNVHFMEEAIEHSSGQGSVAVGEAADSVGADLVVLSSAAVHEKHVDANLLAEFVPAPVLLLP